MNRRGFLRSLLLGTAGLVAGAELDLDRLLWVPGAKTIFLPPAAPPTLAVGDVFSVETRYVVNPKRGNRLVTPDWIIDEQLRIFEGNLALVNQFNQQYVEPAMKHMFDKIDADIWRCYEQKV